MLKIDLLPRHFAIARLNKKLIVVVVIALIAVAGFWLFRVNTLKATIAETQAKLDEVKVIADKVRGLEQEASQKESELAPIQEKVDFVAAADESGGQFWDRFHAINKYISNEAQMSDITISDSAVEFNVTIRGTLGVARFLLNLLRCPDISDITYSGISSGAGVIAAETGVTPSPGMMGDEMMMDEMMMEGEMMPPEMGAPMPSMQPTTTVVGAEPGSPQEIIPLRISATLIEPTSVPVPPGMPVRGAGMMGMEEEMMAEPGMEEGLTPEEEMEM